MRAAQQDNKRLTREQMRSLWLHRAVAGKLLMNPKRALTIARRNLRKLQRIHRRGRVARILAGWERLLAAPARLEAIADVLTSKEERAIELRRNSPFAGVLSEREREALLIVFRRESANRSV